MAPVNGSRSVDMLVPVILSGGAGTRLWPLSRELYPKQLLPLVGPLTMLQETLRRLDGVDDVAAPVIVCNETHRFLVAEQLRQIGLGKARVLLEPAVRNTAPAVAVAAMVAADATGGDPLLLVLPADHVIRDNAAFHVAIAEAMGEAQSGRLVTFGVKPHAAETGFGYIKARLDGAASGPVEEFVEKPDLEAARSYLQSGDYLWNSGMFLFRASRYLEELGRFAPDMLEACRSAVAGAREDLDFLRLEPEAFKSVQANSIDYAVMEKAAGVVVVALDAGWSDVGSWDALHEASPMDAQRNVRIGDVLAEDCRNSYLHSTSRLVAAVGLEDHVVVETSDAVMVAPRARAQEVKALVERLKRDDRYETALHRQVFRPWGSYDSIDRGDRFQVKRLIVNPGAVLSLQMHHHRAEHWIVVAGTARVTRNDEVFLLEENESTYIPIGATHRIENPGKLPLHIIEVQSGSYFGEDDIVRFEDNYGRQGTTT
ncbi:MAG: mannose-1-phosphate guanylyltransferase/mannose-6-phosphate isomerase [Gammaproteobacteria bacterium]|nr:mannose-1-phosphate guanylyltransferase/mannose-6-phosphate isomerase [Gammaproteobacteria bacterium]